MIKYMCSCLLLSLLVSFTPAFGDANVLKNPGFENGIEDWSDRSCKIEAVTTPVHSGAKSAKVFGRTAEWQGIKQSLLGKVLNGKTYKISAWVRLENADANTITISIEQADDKGTKYKNVAKATASKTEWVELSGEFTLSASGTLTTLDVYLEGPSPGINFFVDDVVVFGPEATKVEADPNAAKTEPNAPKKNAK
ncbi:MAG: carbohydrate binding domain-containing protein [Sedimentisphaerales bacterium]